MRFKLGFLSDMGLQELATGGEEKLLLAVIEQAFMDSELVIPEGRTGRYRAMDARAKRVKAEARRWLRAGKYEPICRLMGFHRGVIDCIVAESTTWGVPEQSPRHDLSWLPTQGQTFDVLADWRDPDVLEMFAA